MFLFYYIWYLCFEFVHFFKFFFEKLYIKYNKPFIIYSRNFQELSYFEKLFLMFFYKINCFTYSFAHLKNINEVNLYRTHHYPNLDFFFSYKNKHFYKNINLSFLTVQFNFFKSNNFFKKIIILKHNKIEIFLFFYILYKIWLKKYFQLKGSFFFLNESRLNLLELNFFFFLFLINSKKKLLRFNFYQYDEWYYYVFKKNMNPFFLIKLSSKQIKLNTFFRLTKLIKILKFYQIYKKNFKYFLKFYNYKTIFWFKFSFKKISTLKINFNYSWFRNIKKKFIIRYSESSVSKHINFYKFYNFSIFYLRKNRIFNKSRYSRNRQLYRTGVYWCLWLNIILVYGLYFLFYRFSFNFGYIWWGILILLYSSIFSRVLKYNFFNIYFVFKELKSFISWLGYITQGFYFFIIKMFFFLFEIINLNFFFLKNFNLIIFYKRFFLYFEKKLNYRDNIKIIEIWHGLNERDNSFMKYKTILHWTKLSVKILFYY